MTDQPAQSPTRECSICHQVKTLDAYSFHGPRTKYPMRYCKACRAAKTRAERIANAPAAIKHRLADHNCYLRHKARLRACNDLT